MFRPSFTVSSGGFSWGDHYKRNSTIQRKLERRNTRLIPCSVAVAVAVAVAVPVAVVVAVMMAVVGELSS